MKKHLLLLTGGLALGSLIPLTTQAQVLASSQSLATQRPGIVTAPQTDGGNTLNAPKAVSLRSALNLLEKRYGASFIYRSDLIDAKVLPGSQASGRLEEDLRQLLEGSQLNFERVRENFYIIRAKDQKTTKTLRQLKRVGLSVDGSPENPLAAGSTSTDMTAMNSLLAKRIGSTGLMLNEILQDRAVTGKLSDENGTPLPGASVTVKGTNRGTTTNADGGFSISVPNDNAVLVFSFIGYTTQEVAVGARSVIDLRMTVDTRTLEEFTYIGYGVAKKKDLAASVSTAGRKEFGDVNVSDANQLLQGKLAGVNVTNNSGLPGTGTKITIRGVGTFTNSNPLYVIDGIQGGDINSVSPYDIENITVLKDASSTAIYGAAAANGVVIVTTKRGKSGTPKLSYTGYAGVASPWKKLDLLNASQYVDLVRDIQTGIGGKLTSKLETPDVRVDRTNWQDEIYRNARLTEHYLNLAGGSEKSTFSISMGYTNQQAIMRNYDYERINFRGSFDQTVGRFKFGQNFNFRYSVNRGNAASFTDALRMPPYAPTIDPTNLGGFGRVTTTDDLNDAFNPLTTIYLTERKARETLLYTQLFGEVAILDGLRFKTQLGLNFNNWNGYNYQKPNANGQIVTVNRQITEYYGYNIGPILENFLSYDKTFGIHAISAVAGNTYMRGGLGRSMSALGSDISNDEIIQIGVAPKSSVTSGSASESAGLAYFGRVNYTLMDKYVFTASFRRDGSYVFGTQNRFGNFPGFGVAWKVTEEDFMKNLSFISDLKVRASWGKTGNNNIPFGITDPTVWRGSPSLVYSLGLDKGYVQGSTINSIANPALRWESTTQTDIGMDIGLFGNRLNLTLDYYNRLNDGLLLQVPIPPSTGVGGPAPWIPSAVWQNAASAFNKGVELSAQYRATVGKLSMDITGNVAYNENQVTSLGEGVPFAGGSMDGGFNVTRTAPGYSLGYFYGYKVDRVVSNTADLRALGVNDKGESTFQKDLKPGDIVFQDLNGDGKITEDDQTFLGSPIPKWNYGGNVNLRYGAFDAMIALQGVGGVKIYNALNYWLEGMTRPFNANTDVLRRWQKEGDVTDVPRAGQNANLNLRPSDRLLESGNFMRVRNVTVGYSLPSSLLTKTRFISSLRVYGTAQNLLTFTKYSGYDPEVSSPEVRDNAQNFLFSRGVDRGQYPQPRSFQVGLQASF